MKYIIALIFALVLFTGCSSNSKNLSFDNKTSKNFRVTFHCAIPFDDIRLVRSFEDKNTTKDVYYVEFNNIYESYFEVTQTKHKEADFSAEEYIQFIRKDGANITSVYKNDGIIYLTFTKGNKQFNQLVHANGEQLTLVNAEPMMFKAIQEYCQSK